MTFQFAVPIDPPKSAPAGTDKKDFSLEPGQSMIFVGANGGGKTRLAVFIERSLGLKAFRISAHRALNLKTDVAKVSEKLALLGLRTGHQHENASLDNRLGSRWNQQEAVALLNDYNFLIQSLFADQSTIGFEAYRRQEPGAKASAKEPLITKFHTLREIWTRLLPHRQLAITADDIQVIAKNSQDTYRASEMSDGERAIFYLIGQVLVAAKDSVLIVDEPELHVHRSIMSKLWDELEASRPDCGFIFIIHDLEFAAARTAQKFVIRDYDPAPRWTIDEVPSETGFSEELTTLILGSRKPILFVEGASTSLDLALYRCCYPDWTVIPCGSCNEVIHSVATFREQAALTRITCSGIVDGDHYTQDETTYLSSLGIMVLPVSEIENLFLLPDVSRAIAVCENFSGQELEDKLNSLTDAIFEMVNSPAKIESVVARFCRRRIDRLLKKVDLKTSKSVNDIQDAYTAQMNNLDIVGMGKEFTATINRAIASKSIEKLLALVDDKGMLATASKHLSNRDKKGFESWLTRTLRNNKAPSLSAVISKHLPKL